jgi:hypothetical protein
MAAGTYKSGVQINLVYQAAGLLADAAPVGTVFDEAGALDSPKSTSLTSQLALGELTGVAAGRYLGHFTPDAEGRWTVVIQDKNGAGEVSKVYEVCGHNVDSVGDAVGNLTSNLALVDTADVASQLLLTQSAVNAATASDLLLLQSTLGGYISNVESAVDLISSPAMVS